MSLAIAEARAGIRSKNGRPFGAVIVKNGKVIASGQIPAEIRRAKS